MMRQALHLVSEGSVLLCRAGCMQPSRVTTNHFYQQKKLWTLHRSTYARFQGSNWASVTEGKGAIEFAIPHRTEKSFPASGGLLRPTGRSFRFRLKLG